MSERFGKLTNPIQPGSLRTFFLKKKGPCVKLTESVSERTMW